MGIEELLLYRAEKLGERKGEKKGEIKGELKGRKLGRQEGIIEGRQEGEQAGAMQERMKTVARMKSAGLESQFIASLLGLSVREVNEFAAPAGSGAAEKPSLSCKRTCLQAFFPRLRMPEAGISNTPPEHKPPLSQSFTGISPVAPVHAPTSFSTDTAYTSSQPS
jgi:hypothetical protein